MTEEVYLTEENALLRQTIIDKGTIIGDKEILISLLNEKIVPLEEKLGKYDDKNKSIPKTQTTAEQTKNPDTYNEETKNGKTGRTKKQLIANVSKPAQKKRECP
ncbi:hypothetical protein JTB14_012031 [Gonioctena quinquepunctata]|nr:hypothetical protein JTB14_012031 [Gonioctena quinquepunctata]